MEPGRIYGNLTWNTDFRSCSANCDEFMTYCGYHEKGQATEPAQGLATIVTNPLHMLKPSWGGSQMSGYLGKKSGRIDECLSKHNLQMGVSCSIDCDPSGVFNGDDRTSHVCKMSESAPSQAS